MSKTIRFIKKNGEVQYKQNLLNNLENALNTIVNGSYILSVKKEVKKRSLDQNALMWLWFTCIEHETGTDKNDVHDYYCGKFLSRITNINGNQEKIYSGTSKLSTVGMKEFLDKVQADVSSEFGIILPDPNDLRWKEFEEYYKHFI